MEFWHLWLKDAATGALSGVSASAACSRSCPPCAPHLACEAIACPPPYCGCAPVVHCPVCGLDAALPVFLVAIFFAGVGCGVFGVLGALLFASGKKPAPSIRSPVLPSTALSSPASGSSSARTFSLEDKAELARAQFREVLSRRQS